MSVTRERSQSRKRNRNGNGNRSVSLLYWLERVDGRFMGAPLDVEPHEALLHAIRVTAGEVSYCDQQITRLSEEELFEKPTRTVVTDSDEFSSVVTYRGEDVISRWVSLRTLAVERMAKYSKMALDAGIAERQVQVAERFADAIAPLFKGLVEDLNLTPEQAKLLPAVIDTRLRDLERTQGVN